MSITSLLSPGEFRDLSSSVIRHRLGRNFSQIQRYPEAAHVYGLRCLRVLEKMGMDSPLYRGLPNMSERFSTLVVGEDVEIQGPVVLAAGIFKDPRLLPKNIHRLNVGAVTVGGVTGNPQVGNPGKRLWVYPRAQAAVNCMGLNNPGRLVVGQNLRERKMRGELPKCPLILNSCNGLVSQTPEDKVAEHVANFETFFDLVDIFEVNISCPNQKGAQAMGTDISLLVDTLRSLQKKNEELARDGKKKKPIWLKIKPDYFDEGGGVNVDVLKLIIESTQSLVDGYTVTNTTTDRSVLFRYGYDDPGKGGLSGAPLLSKQLLVTEAVRKILDDGGSDKIIVSTGGLGTGETAERIFDTGRMAQKSGADLVGIYTGLMLNGKAVPTLVGAGFEQEYSDSLPRDLSE